MLRVAYTSWTWIDGSTPEYGKKTLEQSFKELKYLGYDYVENFAFISDYYADDPSELVRLTEKYGIKLVNLYGHFSFDVEKMIEVGKKQIDFIAAIGGESYNCQNSGFGDDGPSERPINPEMLDKMCVIANTLGEYAIGKGVKLCFHPHYGTCVFNIKDIDYLAAHTDPRYVFFCIDTAHSTLAGIDPAELIKKYGDRIGYIHFKDVDTHSLKTAEGPAKMGTFRALGLGTVDFVGVKAALEEVGYDGVVCVELDRPAICNFNSADISRKFLKNTLGL